MKTEKQEVKTFVTRLYCDCGEEMKIIQSWADSETRYIYQCPKCETETETMTDRYPKVEFRGIE